MSSRPKTAEGPLTRAAAALESEIGRYEEALKEIATTPIHTEKALHRARLRLEQCAELEQRLGVALQAFADAMRETQGRQQKGMDASREAAQRIEQRFASRSALLGRMQGLADQARGIGEPVNAVSSAGADDAQLLKSLQEAGDLTSAAISEADGLLQAAKADEWNDIERDTETLKAQLQAARNKLLLAQRTVAGRSPS